MGLSARLPSPRAARLPAGRKHCLAAAASPRVLVAKETEAVGTAAALGMRAGLGRQRRDRGAGGGGKCAQRAPGPLAGFVELRGPHNLQGHSRPLANSSNSSRRKATPSRFPKKLETQGLQKSPKDVGDAPPERLSQEVASFLGSERDK